MIYDLSNDFDRERLLAKVTKDAARGEVVEYSAKAFRSLRQNGYLHLLCGVVAMETGESVEYVKENYFKRMCNSALFVLDRPDSYVGRVEILRSTRDLTKEEMNVAIDRFKRWGEEQGWYMPAPEDREILRHVEVEMAKQNRWL